MRPTRSTTLALFVGGLLLAAAFLVPAWAKEVPTGPGVTVLRDRTIPPPYGVSPEMLEVVAARRIPGVLPSPTSQEEWLKLQKAFDAPGEELGRQAAKWR